MDESYRSWLLLIPGVSSDLAKRIAERYPDPALLRGATAADLEKIAGMTGDVAGRVLELVRAASTADASWYREEPSLYLCPECGSFVGKGTSACPFCGVVFDEGDAPSPTRSPVEELLQARNGEAKICTRCGAFLEPGTTACGVCGSEYGAERVAGLPAVDTTPLPDRDLFLCPHCGAFLSQADAACAICGSPVDAEARIPGLAREGKGVSKDFLSRWQRVTSEATGIATAVPTPRTLEDELAEYERILDADPTAQRAWVHKGRILARLGRTEPAIACFDRAARIDPENEDLYRIEALGLLGPAPDLSVLPPRWKEASSAAPVEDLDLDLEEAPRAPPVLAPDVPAKVAPAPASVPKPQREAPKEVAPVSEPATPPPVPTEVAAIRRALTYYDRLLSMDSGLRVAWQTKGELLLRLGRKADADVAFQRAADLEVAEREFGRAALTGLQTRGPVRSARARGTATEGRTNGRVNGLTNGRRGRTNGRVNGLTNGSGATNGLTNGLGRVNGLMSGLARGEGRTNGLVNGNGFTNGRRGRPPKPLPSAGREWARSLAGIAAVVLLMVLAPILASMFTTTPAATGIAIDGSFGDWNAVSILYSDPVGDTRGNPDVDLVAYKLQADEFGLSVYARMNGIAFPGASNRTELLVALIDSDRKPATGYDAGGLGADYAVELVGWDYQIREAPLYRWQASANRTDWFGFTSAGSVDAASSLSEIEFSVGIDGASSARILLAAVDGLGRGDVADAIAVAGQPALSVRVRTIAPDVITTTTGVGVLRIDLTPVGLPVSVTGLNITKRGSLPDSSVSSLTLFEDDGDGVLTASDLLQGTATISVGVAPFAIARTLTRNATWFIAADLGGLPANETFGLSLKDVAARDVTSVASVDFSLSYLSGTPAPTVDGAFADWTGIPRSADSVGDVANRTGIPAFGNANVDLTEVASSLSANATFYLRVDGTMLGGIDVPNLRARTPPAGPSDTDLDGVPDAVEFNLFPGLRNDFNNDNRTDVGSIDVDADGWDDWPNGNDTWLNTTIPAWYPAPYAGRFVSRYIGPVAPRTLEGVDSAIVYVDGDNRSTTGLVVTFGTETRGLDWAVVVVGRHGVISASDLYRYVAGSLNPWQTVTAVPAALDSNRLEVSVPDAILNLSAGYQTVYYATDWQLSFDFALPVPPGRSTGPGSRSPLGNNVVINEISPRSNPEWLELANPTAGSISLAAWTLQSLRGNGIWITFYTFSAGSTIGAWGSGAEYLAVNLPQNSLPNGGESIRLRNFVGSTVDQTTYPNIANGRSWSRFKDPTAGKPMDSDTDGADFYISVLPSKGGPNDRHRPTVTVVKTADRATAAPGDTIGYTIYYNNTNTGRANHVWVNDTLPAQVTFLGSSAAPTGNSGQTYFWHFVNVGANSLNSFTVTVRVNSGVANGASMVNRADLEYTDQLNRKMTSSSAWRNLTVQRPVITVAKIGDKTTALPGDTIVYTIFYNNTGSANAQHVWINDTLPSDVTFLSSSVPPTSSSGQTYRWHFTNVAPGPHSFTITVRVNLNATSSSLVNWVFLNYTTQNGFRLEPSQSSWTTSIPEFRDLGLVALVPVIFLAVRRLRRGKKE